MGEGVHEVPKVSVLFIFNEAGHPKIYPTEFF